MSFIFLAIMDTLPHRQPPAEPRLKPMPPQSWISARTRVHLAEGDFKSNAKLRSCILKTVQTTHDVLHIQTLCNSANHSKLRKLVDLALMKRQTISHKFHFNFTLLSFRLCSKNHHCFTQTNLRLTFQHSCIASSRFKTFPDSSPDPVSFEHWTLRLTFDLWGSAVSDSIGPDRSCSLSIAQYISSFPLLQLLRLPEILVCHHVRCCTRYRDCITRTCTLAFDTVNSCCLLGLRHAALYGPDSNQDCRRVLHRLPPNGLDQHGPTGLGLHPSRCTQPCKCFNATIFGRRVLTTRESCDLAMVS